MKTIIFLFASFLLFAPTVQAETYRVTVKIRLADTAPRVESSHSTPIVAPKGLHDENVPPSRGGANQATVSAKVQASDLEIAKYIQSKNWDYTDAIRIAKSENYWNLTKSFDCARTHVNKDGSVDVGIFMINSVHESRLKKLGMTLEDMKDCKKNIDYAYEWLFKYQGWNPWYAYLNGSYLSHSIVSL